MWTVLRDFALASNRQSRFFDKLFLTFFAFSALAGVVSFYFRNEPVYKDFHRENCPWLYAATVAFFCIGIVGPTIRLSRFKDKYVKYVAAWGLLTLVLLVIAFYVMFYALVPDGAAADKYERILNLPPVMAGAWAAALGWYVHHQLSMKIHRTGNSFDLSMQTRTNAQYLQSLEHLRAVYAPREDIPDADVCLLGKRAELERQEAEARGRHESTIRSSELMSRSLREAVFAIGRTSKVDASITPYITRRLDSAVTDVTSANQALTDISEKKRKLQALEGMRYILNFYEFMAYAVRVGDLDEDMLFNTIGPAVVNFYRRSKAVRKYYRETLNQSGFCEWLEELVEGKSNAGPRDRSERKGWARDLSDQETL